MCRLVPVVALFLGFLARPSILVELLIWFEFRGDPEAEVGSLVLDFVGVEGVGVRVSVPLVFWLARLSLLGYS